MKTIQPTLLLGAHLSVAGGLEQALLTAEHLGCTCVQIFTHSNRQWHVNPLTTEEIQRFVAIKKQLPDMHVVVHASYLINLASPKANVRQLSRTTLIHELNRCAQLGLTTLVLHPGSRLTSSEEEGMTHLIDGLNHSLEHSPETVSILLENMAGQGSSLGHTFEQLAFIRNQALHKKRLGICFDTCHAFAAGYDLTTSQSTKQVMQDFDRIIGLQHLQVIHMNDSKNKQGSLVDRHAHIGQGSISLEAFAFFMNDAEFFHVPKILETPKEDLQDDIKNMTALKKLLTQKNKQLFAIP